MIMENTPTPQEKDENEASVNYKISERFKSMSIKGLKNINLASSANLQTNSLPPQTIPVQANRRRLGGIR